MPRAGLDTKAVLSAAAELADQEGLDAVTLAALAQKLDIRSPSLYNHVDGLTGLRRALAVHALERLQASLVPAAAGRSGDEAVRALGQAYIAFARSHPGLYEAALRAPDPAEQEVAGAGEPIVQLIVSVLEAYGLEGDAALHAVRGLRSVLHGFASLEQKGGFGLPLDLDVTLKLLIDTFIAGLRTMRVK